MHETGVLNAMQKIAQRICRIQLAIGTLFMVCFFIATTIQIAARYLGIVAMWTEEVAVYSFIYAVFMGASIMLYYDEHFKFTGLIDKFPVKMRTSFNMIMTILVMCFTLFLFASGLQIVKQFWSFRLVALPFIRMGYIWTCIPVAGLTMSLYSFNKILIMFHGIKKKEG